MHDIARKTKQETVSMRIITLVTLFFLPGTFIGVSAADAYARPRLLSMAQTFMSTDIIHFNTNNTQDFQVQGLKVFLGICLPLMFVTFLGWYLVYWWVNRKENGPNIACDVEKGETEKESSLPKEA
jgi:ribose/xylose/arabinose/galactoside ABC-type transport system permease subunit